MKAWSHFKTITKHKLMVMNDKLPAVMSMWLHQRWLY